MIERIRYSIHGERRKLEELLESSGVRAEIVDLPARSAMYFTLETDTPAYRLVETFVASGNMAVGRHSQLMASPDELRSCDFFTNVGCCWIEDNEKTFDPVQYSGVDACPSCGKGSRVHDQPLRGKLRSLRKFHLVRIPPALVTGSMRLAALVGEHKWSGVQLRPIVERSTKSESDMFREFWIASVLPAMHSMGSLERSPIPQFCEKCRRLGYQLKDRQPVYSKAALEEASDFNISCEWWARHYVSGPDLICSRRVVHELLKLEPTQKWIPVKLVD